MTMSKISSFKIDGTEVGNKVVDDLVDFVVAYDRDDQLAAYTVSEISMENKMLQPNELRFTLRRDDIARTQKNIQFALAPKLLSKTVECTILTALKGNIDADFNAIPLGEGLHKFEFKGVIVSAVIEGLNVNCVALSKDYELSLIPHCNYFIDQTLQQIVESIYTDNATRVVNPRFTDSIPYVVQYNETDYEFLVRLAKRYGEFFFFNQKHGLVFGIPPDDGCNTLKCFVDFFSVQYELNSGNPNHAFVANHYLKEGEIHATPQAYTALSSLFTYSKDASSALDAGINLFYDYPYPLPESADVTYLNNLGQIWSKSDESGFVTCRCLTYRLDLEVGSVIEFKEKAEGHDYDNGRFFVTSVHLSLDCNGSPVNEITAIGIPGGAVGSLIPPYFDVNAYPRSSAQHATVVDNVDPLKLGRVLVAFAWQMNIGFGIPDEENEKKKLPWIRIAQPYGGKNKGCYILPEIGEEVIVGFEHDNMEKPFVIGTLFNNSNPSPMTPDVEWVEAKEQNKVKNENNEVKAFRTKNGHTIEFHDTAEGDGFIRIYGNEEKKPNYDIRLSTDLVKNKDDDKTYRVAGPDDGAKDGGDISLKKNGEDNGYEVGKLRIMVQSYGGDIMLDAGDGDIIMNAANIRINTTANRTTLIGGKDILKVNGAQLSHLNSNSLVVEHDQVIKIKGKSTETFNNDKASFTAENQSITIKSNENSVVLDAKDVNVTGSNAVSVKSGSNSNMNLTPSEATLKASTVTVGVNTGTSSVQGKEVDVTGLTKAEIKCGVTSLSLSTTSASRGGKWDDSAVPK